MAGEQSIVITPSGRLANQMFQLMLATELQRRVGYDVPIFGYDIPEWGLSKPLPEPPRNKRIIGLRGHRFNLDDIALALRLDLVDIVNIEGWGMRLEYYRDPSACAAMFVAPDVQYYQAAADELVLHVRGGDSISGHHPLYFPMPASYYEKVVADSGLRPVFVGELEECNYGEMLRWKFPDAKFLPPASAVSDFQTIRHAPHVALSVSSFSWMAAWLSKDAVTIRMPVCGLFYPVFGAAMLVPVSDERYRFYDVPFPDDNTRGDPTETVVWLMSDHAIKALDRGNLFGLVAHGIFGDHLTRQADRPPFSG